MFQNSLAAIPAYTGPVVAVIGFLIALVYNIKFLIVAARNSIWWLLGCIFIPLVPLFFLFVDPDSRRPFVLGIVGGLIAVAGLFLVPSFQDEFKKGLADGKSNATAGEIAGATGEVESAQTLEASEQEIRAWQAKLQAKKAQLLPSDTTGKAAFEEELQRYLGRLEEVKKARAAAGKQ